MISPLPFRRIGFACVMAGWALGAAPVRAADFEWRQSVSATATIIPALQVKQIRQLDFGIIGALANGANGKATVLPGGGQMIDAGLALACTRRSEKAKGQVCFTPQAGLYQVSGPVGASYHINLPGDADIHGLYEDGTEAPMLKVTDLVAQTQSRPDAGANGIIGTSGIDSFGLGGTLRVTRLQAAAHYALDLKIEVTYP